MKILVNDNESNRDSYIRLFESFGYEKNELIFCSSYDQVKVFLEKYLEKKKSHIDLIVTNDSSSTLGDPLRCNELCWLKNTLISSFSNSNFRICSIPIILYSQNESKTELAVRPFDSIVQKNTRNDHAFFIKECERLIKNWRKDVINDLDTLELRIDDLRNFHTSEYFINYYLESVYTLPRFC